MRKIEEIAEQIRQLSREELAELRSWFLEQDWKAWEAQIECRFGGSSWTACVRVRRLNTSRGGRPIELPNRRAVPQPG